MEGSNGSTSRRKARAPHLRPIGAEVSELDAEGRKVDAEITAAVPSDEWPDPPPLPPEDELDPKDVYGPPIPEDKYEATFVSQERRAELFGEKVAKWVVIMRITSGPHEGRHLIYAVPCLPEKRRPKPSYKFAELYAAVSGRRRLPKDLWRRSPRNLLAGAILRVHVVTVKKNAVGKTKPENLWYSKIDKVLAIVGGDTPPAFDWQSAVPE